GETSTAAAREGNRGVRSLQDLHCRARREDRPPGPAPARSGAWDQLAQDSAPRRKASTCAGCSSAFFTAVQCFCTLPSGAITTVERMVPVTGLPYIIFSPQAP